MSPRSAFIKGVAEYGSRSHRQISNDDNWKLLTLPSTPKGQVKVHPTKGIQIRGIHYWSNVFRDPEIHRTYVDVRYDPFDAGIAYAYVRGQWVRCISEYYSSLKWRSEKEIWLATTELQKRQQNRHQKSKVRAKNLAAFLATAEAEEILLVQRLRDAQMTEIFQAIEEEQSAINREINLPDLSITKSLNNDESRSAFPKDNISITPNQLRIYGSY